MKTEAAEVPSRGVAELVRRTKAAIDADLASRYAVGSEPSSLESTFEAMRYMLFLGGGGKRMRPMLTVAACELCGGSMAQALPFASAVEEIHTYTLIVDDIQDHDVVRRGNPACHVTFGFDTALMAAMRLFERGTAPYHALAADKVREVRTLLDLLHRGQSADLAAERWPANLRTLENLRFIHAGKTSSLIQLALLGGAVAAGAAPAEQSALLEYGHHLGLAFQARDDVLSATSTTAALGKPAGPGADASKLTHCSFFEDVRSAQTEAERLAVVAVRSLAAVFGDSARTLSELARFAATRAE